MEVPEKKEVVIEIKKTPSERWGELLAETKKIVAKTMSERIPQGMDAPIKLEILKNMDKFRTSLEWWVYNITTLNK